MKLKGVFEFLGIEDLQGKKDPTKTFHNVSLLQGTDVVKVFLDDNSLQLFTGLKKMEKIDCELNISIGQKTYVNVIDVKKLAA
jgi:hypothetical protein